MEIVKGLRGNQLDPKVVDALCRIIAKKGVRLEGQLHPAKVAV
jgi:HD-GYP domain-containing protein (c-di-GMP phosphodiesterase class II)